MRLFIREEATTTVFCQRAPSSSAGPLFWSFEFAVPVRRQRDLKGDEPQVASNSEWISPRI